MSETPTQLTPEAHHEFVAAVDRISKEAVELHSQVAGLLYTGLLLAAQGAEEVGDSASSTTPGP